MIFGKNRSRNEKRGGRYEEGGPFSDDFENGGDDGYMQG